MPSLREYTAVLRPHPAPGRPAGRPRRSSCTPGPMNRGVEIAAEVADLPRRGRSSTRCATAWRCAWRCCSCCSAPAPTLGAQRGCDDRPEQLGRAMRTVAGHQGRPGHRRHRRAAGPTSSIDGGRIVAVGPDLDVAGDRVLDAGGCVVAPGPGRPAHPPARAGPGGGRDHRDRARGRPRSAGSPRWWPCPTPAGHRLAGGGPRGARRSVEAALCDVHAVGRDHRRPRGRSAGARWPSWPALGVRLFTDDGTGVQDDRLMRRALEYAVGPRASTAGPALRGRRPRRRRPHARGRVVEPPRHPRHPGRGRGADGHPRPRPGRGSPAPRCTSSTCPPPGRWRWSGRPRPPGCPSPPRPRPTTSP